MELLPLPNLPQNIHLLNFSLPYFCELPPLPQHNRLDHLSEGRPQISSVLKMRLWVRHGGLPGGGQILALRRKSYDDSELRTEARSSPGYRYELSLFSMHGTVTASCRERTQRNRHQATGW